MSSRGLRAAPVHPSLRGIEGLVAVLSLGPRTGANLDQASRREGKSSLPLGPIERHQYERREMRKSSFLQSRLKSRGNRAVNNRFRMDKNLPMELRAAITPEQNQPQAIGNK